MKKNILFSLFCTFLLMLCSPEIYRPKMIRIELDAVSDALTQINLKYAEDENDKLGADTLTATVGPETKKAVFEIEAEELNRFRIRFPLKGNQEVRADSLTVSGSTVVTVPLQNRIFTKDDNEMTVSEVDVSSIPVLSLPAAFLFGLFSFAGFCLVFRFKKAAVFALSLAGYFCFSFYYNKNLAVQNSLFTVFLTASLFLWYKKIYLDARFVFDKTFFAFSFAFSVVHLFAYATRNAELFDLDDNLLFAVVSVIGETAAVYAVIVNLFLSFDRLGKGRTETVENDSLTAFYTEHIFSCSLAVILFFYFLFDFVYYPGRISIDMVNQIRQNAYLYERSQHHPFLSSWIMWQCFKAGNLTGNHTVGIFTYILLQNIVCAVAFALSLKRLKEYNMPQPFILGSLMFFAFVPFGLLMIWGVKDVLYSGITVLFVLQTADFAGCVTNRRRIAYFLTALLLCLLRNNGIYVVAPTLLFLSCRSGHKKTALFSLAGVSLVFWLCVKTFFPALGFPEGSKREMFSLPFQQTALYIQKYQSEITQKEYRAINRVLPVNYVGKIYQDNCSDPVKKTYKLDGHKQEIPFLIDYLAVWFQMFFKHPGTYVEAALAQTSLYYTFSRSWPKLPSRRMVKKSFPGIRELNLTKDVRETANDFFYARLDNVPFLYIAYNCGLYTFLFFVSVLYVLKKSRPKGAAPFIPLLFTVLICTASPINGAVRYIMPLMASMPLCIGYACFSPADEEEEIQKIQ